MIKPLNTIKIGIPTIMLASGITYATLQNSKNDVSSESTLEYMDKNPISQGTKAGILALFGLRSSKRKKEDEVVEINSKPQNNNTNDWNQIRMSLRSLADDLYYEEDGVFTNIDTLIEKLDKESKNKEYGEHAKLGLNYIKENYKDFIVADTACNGHFDGDSKNLFWSVYHATQYALFPELVTDKQKEELSDWIELGKKFMDSK